MNLNLNNDWGNILADEIQKQYFNEIIMNIEKEYSFETCYPPKEKIFSAFNYCSFKEVKVVIIGQDPYHGEGEANGLCFSVNYGVKIPPSLRNIFKEINDDLGFVFFPSSGNLESWAKQGVLLLNSSLTVRKDKPNSHNYIKWSSFTDQVIKMISDYKEHIVFLLWGTFAQKKKTMIDAEKHLVLEAGHPSPISANQGKWFGNKHFSKTNLYLKEFQKKEIEWGI